MYEHNVEKDLKNIMWLLLIGGGAVIALLLIARAKKGEVKVSDVVLRR